MSVLQARTSAAPKLSSQLAARSWGPGPFDSEPGLALLDGQLEQLVRAVEGFVAQPEPSRFAGAFAALDLLARLVAPGGVALPAAASEWSGRVLAAFDAQRGEPSLLHAQRSRLEALLAQLATGPIATKPVGLRAALEAQAPRAPKEYTFRYEELLAWLAPYGDDVAAAWAACPRADHLLAIAQARGVAADTLLTLVRALLAPSLAELPADLARHDAVALEQWATTQVALRTREQLPRAALARSAAHLARAATSSDRNHLALSLKVLLDATALGASVAAERAGTSWQAAMMDADGPGWRAYHAKNAQLAHAFRALCGADLLAPRPLRGLRRT